MSDDVPPRRPLRAATTEFPDRRPPDERAVLIDFLEYYRSVLIRKVEGLDAASLRITTSASNLTLGGLAKHSAFFEYVWFRQVLLGEELPEPFRSAPWNDDPDWELTSAAGDSPDDLVALFDDAVAASRAAVDSCESLDQVAVGPPGSDPDRRVNLRWILVHMIEEYARHAGHADLLRESIDGVVDD
ncbi:MAG: DinB family protein [Actinomycetota bacterium]